VALGLGSGGEFRSSMAIAIMGGMITSTFLTLLFVPVAYGLVVGNLDRLSAHLRARKAARIAAQDSANRAQTGSDEPGSGSGRTSANPDAPQTAGD
jgi:hydrophobic/amphiphilic exporter-1 (mainly G- bacteria), HAE1 family